MEGHEKEINGSDEIIGYRIGNNADSSYCPKCYDKIARSLLVHDHILPPGKPITRGEVESITCKLCEETEELIESLKKEKELKEERSKANAAIVSANLGEIERMGQFMKSETDMIGEIAKISRKTKFIKKTVQRASEGHSLNRKNILNFRDFLDELEKKVDTIRPMITLSFFYHMDYKEMFSRETRRLFCTLRPEEQEILRTQFGNVQKSAHDQEQALS
jgi:hypothetical protein